MIRDLVRHGKEGIVYSGKGHGEAMALTREGAWFTMLEKVLCLEEGTGFAVRFGDLGSGLAMGDRVHGLHCGSGFMVCTVVPVSYTPLRLPATCVLYGSGFSVLLRQQSYISYLSVLAPVLSSL